MEDEGRGERQRGVSLRRTQPGALGFEIEEGGPEPRKAGGL